MSPGPDCPHTEIVNRLASEMWYVKDAVTIRMADVEGRVTSLEKSAERKETKQNIILASVLSMAAMMVLHYLFHIGG